MSTQPFHLPEPSRPSKLRNTTKTPRTRKLESNILHKSNDNNSKIQYTTLYSRRSVPTGYDAFGTWFSPSSKEYDLVSILDNYNWRYKLPPLLLKDKRPIWR